MIKLLKDKTINLVYSNSSAKDNKNKDFTKQLIFQGNKALLHNELKEKTLDMFIHKNMHLTTQIAVMSNEINLLKKKTKSQYHVYLLNITYNMTFYLYNYSP